MSLLVDDRRPAVRAGHSSLAIRGITLPRGDRDALPGPLTIYDAAMRVLEVVDAATWRARDDLPRCEFHGLVRCFVCPSIINGHKRAKARRRVRRPAEERL